MTGHAILRRRDGGPRPTPVLLGEGGVADKRHNGTRRLGKSAPLRGEMGAEEQSDYGPTWYSGVTPLPPPRTPLNYDLDVDVCVIGVGLAGLTAAREVARRGWSA